MEKMVVKLVVLVVVELLVVEVMVMEQHLIIQELVHFKLEKDLLRVEMEMVQLVERRKKVVVDVADHHELII